MTSSRNKLYFFLIIACIAGYIWLYFTIDGDSTDTHLVAGCLIKQTTKIPCPSCGSTRSVINLVNGDFQKAFMINPFGYIIAAVMLIVPAWIVFDLTLKKQTLLRFYKKTEHYLQKPQYGIPLLLLVILNWIWNIAKGL